MPGRLLAELEAVDPNAIARLCCSHIGYSRTNQRSGVTPQISCRMQGRALDMQYRQDARTSLTSRAPTSALSGERLIIRRMLPTEESRVIDGDGQRWVVREAAWVGPAGQGRTCLIFENDAVIRRVREYPAEWRTCSDEALYALSLAF